MTYYIDENSFGSEIPENWKEIADYLNEVIDELDIANDRNAVNELWESYWNGDVRWYAVMSDGDDTDWGTGSYDRKKAEKKLRTFSPNGYIAVIDNNPGHDAFCVDQIWLNA